MKRNRIISFILTAVMLLSMTAAVLPVNAALSFNDTDGHWGKAAIEYVVEKGLMNGVGNGESFAPDMSLTRGMVVTVLYRDNGSPKQKYTATFSDVAEGQYYTAAAEWAFANNIVNGTGTDDWGDPLFSPNRDITRQELATMFGRYADFRHVDKTGDSASIDSFPDASSVATWATDAVKWAVGVGLITGKANGGAATLSPEDKAVRAEFATIIKRFKETDFDYLVAYEKPVVKNEYTEPDYPLVTDADVYVAVDGNDNNPGTLEKPLATFEAAKVKVRGIKKNGERKVAFMGGDYGVMSVTMTAEDSGTETSPITYCAYGDDEVYFTNGVYITNDQFKPLDAADKAYFSESNADKIMKVDLSAHPSADKIDSSVSISNAAGMLWPARIPNKLDGADQYYPNMTVNVATPDSPYTMEEIRAEAIANGYLNADTIILPYTEQNKLQALNTIKSRLDSYHTYEGVQICGYVSKVWHQDMLNIKSYDKATGVVEFFNKPQHGFVNVDESQKAFISNASEELDAVGEYWLDTSTKTLYIYGATGNYYIATDGTFIRATGAHYMSFVNLNFRCTKASPVALDSCDNVTFDRTDVSFVSGNGGFEVINCLNFTLKNSDFGYFSGYGIYFDGLNAGERPETGYDYMALMSQNVLVENNCFHDIALVDVHSDVAAVKLGNYVIGARIAHNEFYNSARHAISFGQTSFDVLIEYNEIHDCMTNSADGGAIHNGRGIVGPSHIMRYNLIYDIVASHQGGTYGIYLDDFETDNELYGNVFYNVTTPIVTNRGRDNYIHDNVLINSGNIMINYSPESAIKTYFDADSSREFQYQYHTLLPKEDSPYYAIWAAKCPNNYKVELDTEDFYNRNSAFVQNNTVVYNYFIDSVINFNEDAVAVGTIENNFELKTDENPFFANPAIGDYSVVKGEGLADNHFDKIGRY
ncbi:MAG: S-layer homology domain-containing protein [Clostridia bacterium]|nr:S-layer homology domain-containing protein [Clostridia bacterium]